MKISHILNEARYAEPPIRRKAGTGSGRLPIHWTFKSDNAKDKFYEYQTRGDMIEGQHVEGTYDEYQFPGLTPLAQINFKGARAREELFHDDEGNVYAYETDTGDLTGVATSIGLKMSDMLTFFD